MDLAERPLSAGPRAKLTRSIWRRLLWWRYLLFQRHRYDRLVLETVAGRPFLVLPQVFNPKLFRTGELLAQTLARGFVAPGGLVLDMGTGSGVGAVFAAAGAARVVAIDVNPAAVRCARINALLNQVENSVEVRLGDLFEPLGDERFDLVLFNPPYFRHAPRNPLDHAWRSIDTVERFAAGLRARLTPGGAALVVLSTDGDPTGFLRSFREHGFALETVAERDLRNEVLTVYRLS